MDSDEPPRRLVHVCMHAHSSITRTSVSARGCLSARVYTNECVGMPSSGGRMPFLHPSLPIISHPDKTLVCWRLQDQTMMSRQLSSQHIADARWLSLNWVLGYMHFASGGQLIREGNCDIIWWHSCNPNYQRQSPCFLMYSKLWFVISRGFVHI